MDGEYFIELHVPNGIDSLAPVLPRLPVDLEVGWDEATGAAVLVQSKVSTVAGVWCSKADGEWQVYEVTVSPKAPGDPDDVMRAFSRVFIAAGLTHRCFSVHHAVGENELLLSHDEATNSTFDAGD